MLIDCLLRYVVPGLAVCNKLLGLIDFEDAAAISLEQVAHHAQQSKDGVATPVPKSIIPAAAGRLHSDV
jgi:hypothetical protein